MTTATTTPAHAREPRRRLRLPRALPKLALLALVVVAVALAALAWARRKPAPLVQYETVGIDRGPIAAKVTATGTVSALVTVIVGSQVSGRIAALDADFGSQVKKGQTIASIDPSLFQAAVAQARANNASARAGVVRAHAHAVQADKDFAHAKALLVNGLISRTDYDAAEAALAAAKADETAANAAVSQTQAALDQAELNLHYTTIISPIDGIVISRNVDVGQTVAATFQAPTLFTIAQDLTRMQVDTNVAEADVGKVQPGMKATFTVDAYPSRAFEGTVRQVRDNATTIQNVVTYDAVVDVANPEQLLKPGMTASVTFTYATRADVLRVPNGALRFKPDAATLKLMHGVPPAALRPDERVVWVLRGEDAKPEVLKIGISDGITTEIAGGEVHPGDRAVVEARPTTPPKRGP